MNEWDVIGRILAALAAGGAIGLERSYHGRAAGLRTYALVSFGSALLVAGAQYDFSTGAHGDGQTTRVIQGIVTGIGFLGAGVIVKEGFTVRGLTTAASIWVASAIGVVIGGGSYVPGIVAAIVTLLALTLLRRLEDRLPSQQFVHVDVGFDRRRAIDEAQLLRIIEDQGFALREMSYELDHAAQLLEYRTIVSSTNPNAASGLEKALAAHPDVARFRIAPGRD